MTHQFDEDIAQFNRKPVKRAPLRPHSIIEYRALADYVLCNCSFAGTVAEYEEHSLKENRGRKSKKNYGFKSLEGIPQARFDYPMQGGISGGHGNRD